MWFEALPSMMIVGLSIMIPQGIVYCINYAVLGNPMRRNMEMLFDRNMFTRDERLTGRVWKLAGLENIPDE